MAAVVEAAIYSILGFSLCLAGSAMCVMFLYGSTFHLEPGTIHPFWNLTGTGCLRCFLDFPKIELFLIRDRGTGDVHCCNPPSLNFRLPSNIETVLELPCI